MSKWWTGGANIITQLRWPCMIVAIYALFVHQPVDFLWHWIGGGAVALGIIFDALDGYYARRWQKGGPTREGQYLDQFVDKWGFVYPLFGALTIWHPMPWHLPLGMTVLLALDIVSCRRHRAAYDESVRLNHFDRNKGANKWGKAKFWLQNFVICSLVASRAPAAPQIHAWYATASDELATFARNPYVVIVTMCTVWLAVGCACLSLNKRKLAPALPNP